MHYPSLPHPIRSILLLALILFLSASSVGQVYSQTVSPQTADTPGLIQLQAATFDPLSQGEPVIASAQVLGLSAPVSPYYLVQFSGPVEAEWAQQVTAAGGQVLGYIPDNAHIVRIQNANQLAAIGDLPAVRWIGSWQPAYKIAPTLLAQATAQLQAADQTAQFDLIALAFAGESLAELEAWLRQEGATIIQSGEGGVGPILHLTLPAAKLSLLVAHPAISWVDFYAQPQLDNAAGRRVMGVEKVWQDLGYYGAGQIVAISDSGLSVQTSLSADFEGSIVRAFAPSEMNVQANCRSKTNWTDLNGHGTHVAGSVLGRGRLSGSNPAAHDYVSSHAGSAPEAKMVFMALNTDGSNSIQCVDLNGDFIAKGYDNGARISSNSWGGGADGSYRETSSIVDDYIWRHKDYLVLYSAGNSGPGPRTIGSPGSAKNVLTIGASENNRPDQGEDSDNPDAVIYFSSRGPTLDGRTKPDVVAPGTLVISVRGAQAPASNFEKILDANYAFNSGTSMATPLAAGGAALVREWLGKARGLANPSAALQKAVIINGATQLPSAVTPNNESGRGRMDVKNTLEASYAVLDDHAQGLTTGQSVSYTVQVIGGTGRSQVTSAATSPGAMASYFQIAETSLVGSTSITSAFTLTSLPGFDKRHNPTPILSSSLADKSGVAPLPSTLANSLPQRPKSNPQRNPATFQPYDASPQTNSFLLNMVGGGDFEDPDWTDFWSEVWLGEGVPLRTSDANLVLNGEYSMWLGGTPVQDLLWYPIQFPDTIDSSQPSLLQFDVRIFDEDPTFDTFCVSLINFSGDDIGPFATAGPDCVDKDGAFTYKTTFSAADLQALAGETAYLVLFIETDNEEPHMSAILDDIILDIDFPNPTLQSDPNSGPPGTTFLLTGKYHTPYGEVAICIDPCNQQNYIDSTYADAAGDIAIYLDSAADISPGVYTFQSLDYYDRPATTSVTIGEAGTPTLSVNPATGTPGTTFQVNGANFLPNDNQVTLSINQEPIGTISSKSDGTVSFAIETSSNTPTGTYTIDVTDSDGHSASTEYQIIDAEEGSATLRVTPESGPPGTSFIFDGSNFAPNSTVDVVLDGQTLGQTQSNIAGSVQITLETESNIAPGRYNLSLAQGSRQATAQFEVTKPSGGDPTASGLQVTLVWSDPPAQAAAAKTLVNDLDLQVSGPGGTFFGNGGNSPNRSDNVETLRLSTLPAGTYIITVRANSVNGVFGSQPFALVATTRQSAATSGNNLNFNPGPSAVGTLSGVVFLDANQNGSQDTGEVGIKDAQITVQQVEGVTFKRQSSDKDGGYSLTNLPMGSYSVQISLPAGYSFTNANTFTVQIQGGGTSTQNVGAAVRVYLPMITR